MRKKIRVRISLPKKTQVKQTLPISVWKEKFDKKTQEISKDSNKQGVVVVTILNLIIIALVLILLKFLPPEVPLFFGLPEGEQQLAPSLLLIIPSALSLVLILINSLLSSFLKDDFFKKTLSFANYTVTFFSVIATIKIFLLVGVL